jgi:hypothetical protein
MAKQSDGKDIVLKPVQPLNEIIIPAPESGFLGKFLEETENMLKARAMRMSGLLRRINESGQRTENLLRSAAERMDSTYSKLEIDLRKEGLVPEDEDSEIQESHEENN